MSFCISLFSCRKVIFLSWDTDLDLYVLLGEYTEDEKDDSGSELDDYDYD